MMNYWNIKVTQKCHTPIKVLGRSIAILHKVLREEDKFKAMRSGRNGASEPTMAIDLTSVTCIQEDYKLGGTVVIDKKTAVIVKERFDEVLAVWAEVQGKEERACA